MPSADETLTPSPSSARTGLQRGVLVISALAIATPLYQLHSTGPRMPALLIIGVLLGVTLYHASFGFTGAYHNLFARKDPRGVQAQLLMVAVATLLFAPLLSQGHFMDRALGGAVAPAGWQVAIGAFAFGVGMQLGGGCGSGTLFAAGGGGLRQVVTPSPSSRALSGLLCIWAGGNNSPPWARSRWVKLGGGALPHSLRFYCWPP